MLCICIMLHWMYTVCFCLWTTLVIWNYTRHYWCSSQSSQLIQKWIYRYLQLLHAELKKKIMRQNWGNLVYPSRVLRFSLSLLREGTSGLLLRAELGHLFHISLHAQSRWMTAVIGIRDSDTLQRLSLLRCRTSILPLMLAVKHLMMSKSQKRISAKAHTAEVSVHQFWNVNELISFCSAPSFCWMWLHLLQFFFFQDFT